MKYFISYKYSKYDKSIKTWLDDFGYDILDTNSYIITSQDIRKICDAICDKHSFEYVVILSWQLMPEVDFDTPQHFKVSVIT